MKNLIIIQDGIPVSLSRLVLVYHKPDYNGSVEELIENLMTSVDTQNKLGLQAIDRSLTLS